MTPKGDSEHKTARRSGIRNDRSWSVEERQLQQKDVLDQLVIYHRVERSVAVSISAVLLHMTGSF